MDTLAGLFMLDAFKIDGNLRVLVKGDDPGSHGEKDRIFLSNVVAQKVCVSRGHSAPRLRGR